MNFKAVSGRDALTPGLYRVVLGGVSKEAAATADNAASWSGAIAKAEQASTGYFQLFRAGLRRAWFAVRFPRTNYVDPYSGLDAAQTPANYAARKSYDPATGKFTVLVAVTKIDAGAQVVQLLTQVLATLPVAPPAQTQVKAGGPWFYRSTASAPVPNPQPVKPSAPSGSAFAPKPVVATPAPKPVAPAFPHTSQAPAPVATAPSLPAPAPSVSLPKTATTIPGTAPKTTAPKPRPAPTVTATVSIPATTAKAKSNTGAIVAGGLSLVALFVFGVG